MNPELTKNIIEALGLEGIPEEEQEVLVTRAAELVMQEILISAVEQLPEDQIDAYTALIDTDPEPDAVFEFFHSHIENFDDMVDAAVASVAEAFRK